MPSVAVVALSSDSIRARAQCAQRNEGQVLHRMRRLHSERRLGRISYPHASHKLVDPLLPRRTSAQVFIRTVVPRVRRRRAVSDDRLVGALIDLVRGPETRICSIRGWKTGRVGVARSTVDMHRVRVRNRASVSDRRQACLAPYLCMRIDATSYSAPRSYSATGDPLTVRSVHTEIKSEAHDLLVKFLQDNPANEGPAVTAISAIAANALAPLAPETPISGRAVTTAAFKAYHWSSPKHDFWGGPSARRDLTHVIERGTRLTLRARAVEQIKRALLRDKCRKLLADGASDTSQTASFVGRGPGPARAAGTPPEGLVTYKQLKQNLAGKAAVQVVWDSYHDNLF
ncbi:hypothetical protein EVAR_17498_1 [Eumeta japonica]|uniref:Uncharacterized protein n=1 Tax=Eumeta variegata TaxID=151549 RepID=A0A4C1WR10_EUMVA|nr:hypothetical protein EVAR_17498_1 [Eumeta japonica]